ncbi:hypothetical protein Tsubulata_005617 [Turnera subulata]|uniref:RING-type E3 ubiquitin transferase n=1 Tax=Turnera subulata TaxID=218843 RepID=A0A9Q0JS15_9ROSI|nr:hypothetical protein Tsubulata_005617 [Turnera subulata]
MASHENQAPSCLLSSKVLAWDLRRGLTSCSFLVFAEIKKSNIGYVKIHVQLPLSFSTSLERFADPVPESERLLFEEWLHIGEELKLSFSSNQLWDSAAGLGPFENGSIYYPTENVSVEEVHFGSQWNAAPISNGHISSSQSVEVLHYPRDLSGQSHNLFLQTPIAANFCTIPENLAHHPSSSHYDGQTFHGIDGGMADLTMGNSRGTHKRKSPGIPSACERSSSSLNYSVGSSSNLSPSLELQQEKENSAPQYVPWEHITMAPSYQCNLSLRAEGLVRNVRSRPAVEFESNPSRTHLSRNISHHPNSAGQPIDHSSAVDHLGHNFGALTNGWSHARVSPAHQRNVVSDAAAFGHETTRFFSGSSLTNASTDSWVVYNNDFVLNRNPVVSPGFNGASTHSARAPLCSYPERPGQSIRASPTSLRLGHETASDEGLHMVADSRHTRPLSSIRRNSDRTGRSRASYERYRHPSNEAGLHNRIPPEGFMVMDRSAFYGSRNMVDQHRDMRLDVDNMSYEELLALGERIGSVSTGLSEDLISKCLTEAVYCSSDRIEEGICVICLEEYKDMDDVGVLKTCRHDYHVGCIKKWLSMKNLCPICKTCGLADNSKTG